MENEGLSSIMLSSQARCLFDPEYSLTLNTSQRTALFDPDGLWSHFTVEKTEGEKEKMT